MGLLNPRFKCKCFTKSEYYRIDCTTPGYETNTSEKIKEHIEWLEPKDHLTRATNGFKSAIDFMMAKDNTKHLQNFRDYTNN